MEQMSKTNIQGSMGRLAMELDTEVSAFGKGLEILDAQTK